MKQLNNSTQTKIINGLFFIMLAINFLQTFIIGMLAGEKSSAVNHLSDAYRRGYYDAVCQTRKFDHPDQLGCNSSEAFIIKDNIITGESK